MSTLKVGDKLIIVAHEGRKLNNPKLKIGKIVTITDDGAAISDEGYNCDAGFIISVRKGRIVMGGIDVLLEKAETGGCLINVGDRLRVTYSGSACSHTLREGTEHNVIGMSESCEYGKTFKLDSSWYIHEKNGKIVACGLGTTFENLSKQVKEMKELKVGNRLKVTKSVHSSISIGSEFKVEHRCYSNADGSVTFDVEQIDGGSTYCIRQYPNGEIKLSGAGVHFERINDKMTRKQLTATSEAQSASIVSMTARIEELEAKVAELKKIPAVKTEFVLTKDVFEGVDEKYQWAAHDECGRIDVYVNKPEISNNRNYQGKGYWSAVGAYESVSQNSDVTNWKTSLVSRAELSGSELTKHLLATGSESVLCYVGDLGDERAIDDKSTRSVTSFEGDYFRCSDSMFGWENAVPVDSVKVEVKKTIDQSVFEGAHPKYLFAAVDGDGGVWLYTSEPYIDGNCFANGWGGEKVRGDFDASNWKGSLLRRNTVKAAPKVGDKFKIVGGLSTGLKEGLVRGAVLTISSFGRRDSLMFDGEYYGTHKSDGTVHLGGCSQPLEPVQNPAARNGSDLARYLLSLGQSIDCFVDDDSDEKATDDGMIRKIVRTESDGRFVADNGVSWYYAVPVNRK